MIDAWNTRNWQQVYELFAEDGVLQSMMLPTPTVGREAISKRIGALAEDISRIELRIRHMGVADGVVFIERVDDFVYRGKHGAVPVVGVVEVEQGRVKAWREYYDRDADDRSDGTEGGLRRHAAASVNDAASPRRRRGAQRPRPRTGGKVTSCGSIVLWQ